MNIGHDLFKPYQKGPIMLISILTFDGFNELDSFIAFGVLNRIKKPNWRVNICCNDDSVISMNGVRVMAQSKLNEVEKADAVIIGSGSQTRDIVKNSAIMSALKLDPTRQLIAAQCSGTLILAKLGLLGKIPACTDLISKPWVQEAGVEVLNKPFFAENNIATAGGCFSSQYLAAWIIAKTEGIKAATEALYYVAPVGEKEEYIERAMRNIEKYIL
jgi:transcriptional regulator GlxA family with amidase domain